MGVNKFVIRAWGKSSYFNLNFIGLPLSLKNKTDNVFMVKNFRAIIKRKAIRGEISMYNLSFRPRGKIFLMGTSTGSVILYNNLTFSLNGLALTSSKNRRSKKRPAARLNNRSKNFIRIFSIA